MGTSAPGTGGAGLLGAEGQDTSVPKALYSWKERGLDSPLSPSSLGTWVLGSLQDGERLGTRIHLESRKREAGSVGTGTSREAENVC